MTFKAHDSSKDFNNLVVVTSKRNLWIKKSKLTVAQVKSLNYINDGGL